MPTPRPPARVAALIAGALALSAPGAAGAQLSNAAMLEAGLPASLSLPSAGAGATEEPSAIAANPAGIGFVRDACLQWFHEERVVGRSSADGLYLAGAVGPVGGGLGLEWVRPPDGYGTRYRKTTLALAITDQSAWSIALGWNWLASPDAGRNQVRGLDFGVTLRPWRHLSAGFAALGMKSRLDGEPLPVRYALGLASRIVDDTFTLSADLIADDRESDLQLTQASFGLGMETRFGLGMGVQLLLPIDGGSDPSALVTLTWNGAHGGYTGGVVTRPGTTGWLTGVRASSERYRGATFGGEVPVIDLARELEGGLPWLAALTERDPWFELLRKLEQARDDRTVEGLLVKIGPLGIGSARIEELRARLAEIASRKPVLAYLTGGGTKEYMLAAGTTAIAVAPGSTVFFNGVGVEPLFLRDALARAGIAVDVVRVGAWKSAPEPLTRTEGSREGRETVESILDDVHTREVGYVSIVRGLSTQKVQSLFDRALFTADDARTAGLVDEVLWPDELLAWARRRVGDHIDFAPRYDIVEERRAQRWGEPSTIGVVLVEGTIVPGATRRDPLGSLLAGSDSITAALRSAAEDPNVKAVVLRVDSAGGDGLASDLIWREVQRTQAKKPVVVSMGDMAASGGYLAAVGAGAIVAEPSTLTGSIGVFAMKPDLSGLLEKAGVRREPHQRGDKALVASMTKPWTPAERTAMQGQIDAFYARFVERVASGRKLGRDAVEKVAQGRVWTGRQALERGLVDRLGSLSDAVELARERAGLARDSGFAVRKIDAPRGLLQLAAAAASALSPASDALEVLGDRFPDLRAMGVLAELGPIVALPPPGAEVGR